jgi:hypothetical protein
MQIHHTNQKCLVLVTCRDSEYSKEPTRRDKGLTFKEVAWPGIMPCPSRHDRRSEHGAKYDMAFDTAFLKCDVPFAPAASTFALRPCAEGGFAMECSNTRSEDANMVTVSIPTTRYALSVGRDNSLAVRCKLKARMRGERRRSVPLSSSSAHAPSYHESTILPPPSAIPDGRAAFFTTLHHPYHTVSLTSCSPG